MSEKASVKLSTKSWHYKLIKFILGSAAPTPYNMHNLCPYFWLLVFSLLATPFVAPVKGFAKLLSYLVDGLANIMESLLIVPIANTWEENLTDLDVYYLWNWELDMNKYFLHAHKKEGGISRDDLLKKWWNKNMGEDVIDPKSGETTEKFQKWVREMREKANAFEEASRKKRYEESSKKEERKEKAEKFQRGMDNFFERVGDQFRSWKNLIKWTKRVMGLIITSIGLFVTLFVTEWTRIRHLKLKELLLMFMVLKS